MLRLNGNMAADQRETGYRMQELCLRSAPLHCAQPSRRKLWCPTRHNSMTNCQVAKAPHLSAQMHLRCLGSTLLFRTALRNGCHTHLVGQSRAPSSVIRSGRTTTPQWNVPEDKPGTQFTHHLGYSRPSPSVLRDGLGALLSRQSGESVSKTI